MQRLVVSALLIAQYKKQCNKSKCKLEMNVNIKMNINMCNLFISHIMIIGLLSSQSLGGPVRVVVVSVMTLIYISGYGVSVCKNG